MKRGIKAVIFDWGGVLIKNSEDKMMSYSAKMFGVKEKKFIKIYKNNYEEKFDKGEISEKDLWNKLSKALDVKSMKNKKFWANALRNYYVENKEVIALSRYLKTKGYKLALLSNAEKPTKIVFKERNYDFFDIAIFSCDVGYIKPEKWIYEIVLNKLGVTAKEAVFFDNLEKNVDGAKKAGIMGILFIDYKSLRKELEKKGIL